MKSAEEWLPFDLCSKKLAAVAKIWKSLFVQRFLRREIKRTFVSLIDRSELRMGGNA
jgi:hypothetical protein